MNMAANFSNEFENFSVDLFSNKCFCSDMIKAEYSAIYSWYNFVLIIIALPFLSLFGLLSNAVNIFIYSRPSMISSSTVYLLGLACSDLFVIGLAATTFWFDSVRSYFTEALKDLPYLFVYVIPLGYIAQTCSIYTTVAAAFDCYIKVCIPRASHCWCTASRGRQVLIGIAFGSILYNVLRFNQLEPRPCVPENGTAEIIEICPTDLYIEVNTIYNVYMYMVLLTFLPFFLLSLLNALIVYNVNRGPAANQGGSSDDTVTMIMVVILFLCCNILALVVNVVETFFDYSNMLLNFMTDTSNFLIIFNASLNYVIYMKFSGDFRRLFSHYFCPPKLCTPSSIQGVRQEMNQTRVVVGNKLAMIHNPDHVSMAQNLKHMAGNNDFQAPPNYYNTIGTPSAASTRVHVSAKDYNCARPEERAMLNQGSGVNDLNHCTTGNTTTGYMVAFLAEGSDSPYANFLNIDDEV